MDDPIVLLKEINAKMYDAMEEKYEYETATRVFKRLFNTTQDDGESLQDYTKRFKQSRDNFKNTVGEDFLEQFMTTTSRYKDCDNDVDKKIVQKGSFKGFMAYLYVDQADNKKYRTLTKGLKTQFSLDNDQYPKTITKGQKVLQMHKWDDAYKEHMKKQRQRNSSTSGTQKDTSAEKDTEKNDEEKEGTNMNQDKDIYCFCCGKKGHYSDNCPDKDKIPKEEWAVKKGMHLYCKKTTDKKEEDKDNSEEQAGWLMGLQMNNIGKDEGKVDLNNDILLDTGATFSSFHNRDLIMNVRNTNTPIKMKTNVGSRRITKEGEVPG